MYGTKRNSNQRRGSSGKVNVTDRWARLEAAIQEAQKRLEEQVQHGKVRIIVKDGVPVAQ